MSYLQKAFARQTTIFKNGQYSIGDKCYVGETADEMALADAEASLNVDDEAAADNGDSLPENEMTSASENSDATIFGNFSGAFFTGMQNDIDSILKQYGDDSNPED